MLDFDGSKLRARVIHDFELRTNGINDAREMNSFADAVMSTAVGTVRERLHAFNQQNVVARLPLAVLAACFAYLPFCYRIPPTHVCRTWRSAALSEPSLWSYISPRSPAACIPDMLSTTLSRAGDLPVELRVVSHPRSTPEAVYAAIAPFSRQLRYLAWHCATEATPWDFPAPYLEYFCSSSTVIMTEAFFGGQVGRLRCMYLQAVHMPSVCPVLSTVVDLSLAMTPYGGDTPSTIRNVFELCPQLERLQILGIRRSAAHMLPSGPAPPSLRELSLATHDDDYDLTPHLAWNLGYVRHVKLSQHIRGRPNLEVLAHGSVKLAVSHATNTHSSVMFEHSATVSHAVHLSHSAFSDVAALLVTQNHAFNSVRSAIISHTALEPLVGILEALPQLEHLVLHIEPAPERPETYYDPPAFDWRPLSYLTRAAIRRVRSVTLQVWCGPRRSWYRSPTADDARGLLRALPQDPLPVDIQGFSSEVVDSVDSTGLPVRFDLLTKVGKLILWEREEIYYPFNYGG